jgi:hypothetical protein
MNAPETWEFPWPPIVEWKNLPKPHSYYGKSDVGSLGALNDGLNFVASNTQRILKHHAHPKTIGIGMKGGEVEETTVDGFWTVQAPKSEADIFNLEMQSDLTSSLKFTQMLMRLVYDLSREISPGTVADRLGAITNFGLRVLFYDTLAKSGVKRLLMGEGLTRICRRILEIGGHDPKVKLNVNWPDPLPSDPLQQAQALSIDVEHGLSHTTYLERRGYDPEQEAQRHRVQPEELEGPKEEPLGQIGDTLEGMDGIKKPGTGDEKKAPALGDQRTRPR